MGKHGTEKLSNFSKVTQLNKYLLLNKIWVILLWERKNNFFLFLNRLLAETLPVKKDGLTGEKQIEIL